MDDQISVTVTKLDAAREHIAAAVNLYFDGNHLAPIIVLVNSAREIVASAAKKVQAADTLHSRLTLRTPGEYEATVKRVSGAAGFMKHADRKPYDTFEITENDALIGLWLACIDFGVLAKGLPIEGQVFEAWSIATGVKKVSEMPLRSQRLIRSVIAHFPGIRAANRARQKVLGREALLQARSNPALVMAMETDLQAIASARILTNDKS